MAASSGRVLRLAALAWGARLLIVVAIVAGIVMQVQADEWLPPRHSVSQYANGPGSASFAIALLALGLSTLLTAGLVPGRGCSKRPSRTGRGDRVAVVLLVAAGVGFVLAALISAPPVGEHDSLDDALHQAGAIVGTFGLSIAGLLLGLSYRHSRAGRCLLTVALFGAAALLLLGLVNFDVDVLGFGRRESWALHQSISLICMVLTVVLLPSVLLRAARGPARR